MVVAFISRWAFFALIGVLIGMFIVAVVRFKLSGKRMWGFLPDGDNEGGASD